MSKRLSMAAVAVALAAMLVPAAAWAQGNPGGENRVRLFGGFSYLDFSIPPDVGVPETSKSLYGLQGNLTYYLTSRVGIFADGAFNTGSILPDDAPDQITSADLVQTTLLFGPRFLLVNSRNIAIEAFGAIGWATGSIDVVGSTNGTNVYDTVGQTVFATSFGADVDAMFGNGNWGVRFAQLEVLILNYEQTTSSIRYSGGIVGRF
ncbi:MAG: hypothetical protein PVJ49_07990 [Acidobacteriota bacterium]|jgi:hypothetical protein